jgi:hypothetical protein
MVIETRRSKKPPSTPPRPSQGASTPSSRKKVVPPTVSYPSTLADDSSVSSQGSYISSTDGKRGLSENLQKQLATDIEKAGGIKNLSDNSGQRLARILDLRPDVYGKRGVDPKKDNKRTQIQKKVWCWKQLEKQGTHCQIVLNRLQVKSFATLLFEEKNRRGLNKPRKRDDDETSVSSSSSNDSISSEDSSVVSIEHERKPPPQVIHSPATHKKMSAACHTPNTAVPRGAGKFFVFVFVDPCPFLFCSRAVPTSCVVCIAERIPVNIQRPERNREVLVFPTKDIDGLETGTQFTGHYMMHQIDIRHIADDPSVEFYKGRVFTSNSVLLRVPAFPYSILHNRDEIAANVSATTSDALDDARHSFEQDKAGREWKYLVLDFPTNHELSSKVVYKEAGDDEELELEIIPIQYSHPNITGLGSEHWAAWKVVRTDLKVHKRGKLEVKSKQSKAAALLAGLKIGGGQTDDGMKQEDE